MQVSSFVEKPEFAKTIINICMIYFIGYFLSMATHSLVKLTNMQKTEENSLYLGKV